MFDVDTMIRHLRDLFADHVISYRTMLGLALCSRAISGQIFFFFSLSSKVFSSRRIVGCIAAEVM